MSRRLTALLLAALVVAPAAILAPATTPPAHAEGQLNLDAQGTLRFGTIPLVRVVPDDAAGYTIIDPRTGTRLGKISNYVDDGMFEVEAADGTVMGKHPGTTQLQAAQAAVRHLVDLRKIAGVPAPKPGAVAAATPAPAARAPEPEAAAPARPAAISVTVGPTAGGMRPVMQAGKKVASLVSEGGDNWAIFDLRSQVVGSIKGEGGVLRVYDGRDKVLGSVPKGTDLATTLGQFLPAMTGTAAPAQAARRVAERRVDRAEDVRASEEQGGWRLKTGGGELLGTIEEAAGDKWRVYDLRRKLLGTLEPSGAGWHVRDNHGDALCRVTEAGEVKLPSGRSKRLRRGAPIQEVVPHVFFGPDAE